MSGFTPEGKLDNQEIRKRLLENKYSADFKPTSTLIDSIGEQFWFHDFYNSFISDPVFLKYLIQFLDKTKPKKFNRYDFYEFLFDQTVKGSKREIFQQIAFAFEKLQVDAIDPNDYESLLKAVEAPKGLFDALWMEKNHIGKIGEREDKKLFIWQHHTITEFLVAEYLLGKKDSLEELKKLAILEQEGVTAFKPSWFGVLRFLMDSKEGLGITSWLIEFLEKNPDDVDDNLAELLVFQSTERSVGIKSKIFKLIYQSFFERVFWLPVWVRTRLSKFVDPETYSRLKRDIKKWPSKTETFVKTGNVVSIIEGLLEDNSTLITQSEIKFWREKLIGFANNPDDDGNGVLQRHSLSALAHFKDEKIIPLVAKKCFEETQDSLVRDAFIEFCIIAAPNSKPAIKYFIDGVKKGSNIYARHGLYKITEKESLKYFLQVISNDEVFLKSFLEHESIFDKEEGDHQLIGNIKNILDKDVTDLLKKIIFRIFEIENFYQEERSNFIKQISLLISSNDSNILFEILQQIKESKDETQGRLFFDYGELLATLLSIDNVAKYFDEIENLPAQTKSRASDVVYIARRRNEKAGQAIYDKAVKLKKVEPIDQQKGYATGEKQEADRKKKRLDGFLNFLEPSPGKYVPEVFGYYVRNKKELDEFFKTAEGTNAKKRLVKLAIDDGIRKIDPKDFVVSIPDKATRQFSWSTVASFYGDILSVVKIFAPEEIKKHKQQIIDFIPYAFSNGMSQIMDLISEIKDEELDFVNEVMSDEKNDRRYLIPGSYIHIVSQYVKRGCNLPSAKSVLLSFIGDEYIPDYEQESVLEALPLFIDETDTKTENFLKDIFADEEVNKEKTKIAKAANAALIQVYKDEGAINWRLEQLKKPLPFTGREIDEEAHWVGPIEDELDTMALAKPLIELRDERYLPKLLKLLTHSFKISKDKRDKKYSNYVNYLWRIVIAYVENLKEKGSFKPLLELEGWVSKNAVGEDSNWLRARIRELKKVYVNEIATRQNYE